MDFGSLNCTLKASVCTLVPVLSTLPRPAIGRHALHSYTARNRRNACRPCNGRRVATPSASRAKRRAPPCRVPPAAVALPCHAPECTSRSSCGPGVSPPTSRPRAVGNRCDSHLPHRPSGRSACRACTSCRAPSRVACTARRGGRVLQTVSRLRTCRGITSRAGSSRHRPRRRPPSSLGPTVCGPSPVCDRLVRHQVDGLIARRERLGVEPGRAGPRPHAVRVLVGRIQPQRLVEQPDRLDMAPE